MTAYRRSAADLYAQSNSAAAQSLLWALLADHVRHTTGRRPSPSEIASWQASLPALARDLVDAGLGDVEMLLEYRLPYSSLRTDVILAGVHPVTGADSYVVVELKQWSFAEPDELDDQLVLVPHSRTSLLHPVVQVRQYSRYLHNFLGIFDDHSIEIQGVAYLHNASHLDVKDLHDLPPDAYGRLFTGDRRGEFMAYLKSRLAPKSGAGAGDRFESSAHRPSQKLMEVATAEIRDREQFVLLDEQKIAYELVMSALERARRADTKEVIVISGGPGSGKSVIALSALGELYRQGRTAIHATGSRSFTRTLRRIPGKGSRAVQDLFKYFNNFTTAEKNSIEVLICDEAHRIRATSNGRFTRKDSRSDRSQLAELIDVARVPVFLLDDFQIVKPDEIGSVQAIEEYAASVGLPVRRVDLDAQFRCGGSRAYEHWVLRLLGLERGDEDGDAPIRWEGDEDFSVSVARTPAQLEAMLRGHLDDAHTARMSAGFCWPWSEPRADLTLVSDVVVEDWARPWNVKDERAVGDAPPSYLWATEPGGFGQVGCVYTAQGFEYDWNGVILGPDIVVHDGRLVTVRAENRDPALRGRKATDEQADRLIRHVYKVLLTRAMRGTVLYAVDPETNAFLADLVEGRG